MKHHLTPGALLREYVRLIVEAAASSQDATKNGYALLKTQAYEGQALVLYDPKLLLQASKSEEGFDVGVQDLIKDGIIVGYVRYVQHDSDCLKANEIQSSASLKGYGPLMYDILMSLSPHGIMSDRVKTSDAARKVWNVYDTQRNDVISRKFDDKNNPKTPPKIDDCELMSDENAPYLDKAYKGAHVETGPLEKRHEDALRVLTKAGHNRKEVEDILRSAAQSYFETKIWTS